MNPRAKRLVDALPEDFEAALLLTEQSRFYYLDFDAGDAGTLLLLPGRMVYIIDSRYIESARAKVKDAEVLLETDALDQVKQLLKDSGVKRLHLEDRITLAQCARLKERLDFVELITDNTLSNIILTHRQVKDAEELRRMEAAQNLTDRCFTHILPYIREGVREAELMLEMEHFVRSNGARQMAFETICVAGPNTSLPHGVPGDYKLQKGDFVTMDFGAKVHGYCADMTRTVALGEPGEQKRALYQLVLEAHLAGIAAVKAGAACQAVDAVARDMIAAAGYKENFGHGLGHSLGIDIHEEPRFSPKSTATLKSGMVMTVEPGCYLPGRFGLRIEDAVLVTDEGCHPLPSSEKQLIVL